MRLVLPTSQQGRPIVRAFKAITQLSSDVDERQHAMLAAAKQTLGVDAELDELLPISPAQLALEITDPQVRQQVIQGMVVLSLLDEEAEAGELELVEAFALALDVSPGELKNLRQLVEKRTLALRFDVARRVWFVDRLKSAWNEGGFRWLARTIATLKFTDDGPLAAKYQALADYPLGSLGRCYYEHMREQGFALPGEKGSQVEPVFIHDLTHLLCGYGTDPRGEILAASFSAGNRRDNPFTYIFFVLCQFHLGMAFSPFTGVQEGAFDPSAALWAAKRGMEVNTDLSEAWNYWEDLALPLVEVRRKLGMTLPPDSPT